MIVTGVRIAGKAVRENKKWLGFLLLYKKDLSSDTRLADF